MNHLRWTKFVLRLLTAVTLLFSGIYIYIVILFMFVGGIAGLLLDVFAAGCGYLAGIWGLIRFVFNARHIRITATCLALGLCSYSFFLLEQWFRFSVVTLPHLFMLTNLIWIGFSTRATIQPKEI